MRPVIPVDSVVLDSPPWCADDVLHRVMTVLNDGPDGRVLTRLVGGAVRNAVMGRAVQDTDYDLATLLTPDQTTNRVMAAGMRAIPTGIDHGTVTVVCEGRGFEVTTLRSDISTDGRRATVAFTDDWAKDAARRDFTMNALDADLEGRVHDPLGSGVADARAGAVRFVGDATTRIAEDYLRILRFFRFHALYGTVDMNRDDLSACTAFASKLHTLSRERVTSELLIWMGAVDPIPSLRIAVQLGILEQILPGPVDVDRVARLVRFQNSRAADINDILSRIICLLDGYDPRPVLRLSRTQMSFINDIERMVLEPELSNISLQRDIYRHGYDKVAQRLCLDMTEREGDIDDETISALTRIKGLKGWLPPCFPVTGTMLIKQGMSPGPEIGKRLKELEEQWIQNSFK